MKRLPQYRGFRTLAWLVLVTFLWLSLGANLALACPGAHGGKPKCQEAEICCSEDSELDGENICEAGGGGGGDRYVERLTSVVNPANGAVNLMGGSCGGGGGGGGGEIAFHTLGGRLGFGITLSNQQEATTQFNLGPRVRGTFNTRLDLTNLSAPVFETATGTPYTYTRQADGSYAPPPGFNAKLEKLATCYRMTFRDGRTLQFDLASGHLGRYADRSGNAIEVSYDASGRITRAAEAANPGRRLTFSYNAQGRMSQVADFTGRTMLFNYDASGRLSSVTDPAGTTTTYGYDASDRVNLVTRNGHSTSYTYNADNRVTEIRDALNQRTTLAYTSHSNGQVATCTATDALGRQTRYEYDTVGNLTKVTTPLGYYRQYTYDASRNRTSERDERGCVWNYLYNAYGDRTRVTDPLNHVTQYEYGYNRPDDHLLKRAIDPLGHVTTYDYDALGRLTRVTDPNGRQTLYAWNSNGTLHTVTDPRGGVTTYSYTSPYSPAFVTAVTDPLGHTTSYVYDALGNRTSVTDANGNTTYYAYDGRGRVTQVTNPDNTTRRYTYNCCNLTSVTDENGHTTTYAYDADERLQCVTDAAGGQTWYAYDEVGNLIAVTDAMGHTTEFTYDNNDRMVRVDYPDGTYEQFAYYATGPLYSRRDGNGLQTVYVRDALGLVTKTDYPSGPDIEYTYDIEGRITHVVDGACDTYYYYDSYGGVTLYDQLLAISRKYGSMSTYRTVTYNYDAAYNRTYMQNGAGYVQTMGYDLAGRLTSLTMGTDTQTFAYDPAGNRIRKTWANGAYAEYTYNSRHWLTNLENRDSDDTLLSSFTYTHDEVGNPLTMTEANGDVTTWTYDSLNRLLTDVKVDGGGNPLYSYAYTYDGVGNRLTMIRNGQQTAYTYDSNNKLTQLVDLNGTTTFGYDGNGNMTAMSRPGPENWVYTYDLENRLTAVSNNLGYSAAYTYSGDGLRLRVQESNALYPDLWLQYDGVRPAVEGTLAGDTWTTTAVNYWEGPTYYSPLASRYLPSGGGAYNYLADALGSTRQLMRNATHAITDTYTYDAFGNTLAAAGATDNPYRYVGGLGYRAGGAGLLDLGARQYHVEAGRFVTPDPGTKFAREYLYVGDRPTMAVDPTGRFIKLYPPCVGSAGKWCIGSGCHGDSRCPPNRTLVLPPPSIVLPPPADIFTECADPDKPCELTAGDAAKELKNLEIEYVAGRIDDAEYERRKAYLDSIIDKCLHHMNPKL